ncbi:hypothetical protein [Nocardia blacklockiae]|uniref:hypothetical protein n=1 Tax=Nocardia blacklockiae TaxID=480036 RepID=UPI001894E96C|nr:hypothetical protein [Nocardia blacklockiae]MBF6171523.1 hypothetical protein [Nocardia blacklockiae]
MTTKKQAAQINPIVQAAADQVRKSRRRTGKAKDLPRWECPDQLTLFDTTRQDGDTAA